MKDTTRERTVVSTVTLEIEDLPELVIYLSEEIAMATLDDGRKVRILRDATTTTMFVYSTDGAPGVRVDLRPVIEALAMVMETRMTVKA